MRHEYTTDDLICSACIEDEALRDIVRTNGTPGECTLCSRVEVAVTIQELADIIYPVAEEFYVQGAQFYDEQEGDDLSWLIQDLTGQYFVCEEALIEALTRADPADPRDGDTPFIERSANYKNKRLDLSDHYGRWNSIKHDLKHRRRFFSDAARQYFDSLFADLDISKGTITSKGVATGEPDGVITTLSVGSSVFRARICDSEEQLTSFVMSPAQELGAPPSHRARAGRMNAEGIPAFYSALEEDTCVAELRPSIGSLIVVARFSLTRSLRVLDFLRLDNSYSTKPLSYFQPDATVQFQRRAFLRRIHRLIAEPVLPGKEADYLVTQFLAEYLAHVRTPGIDGAIFKSTQRPDGANLVLFPVTGVGDAHPASPYASFPIACAPAAPTLFTTTKVQYDSDELEYAMWENEGAHVVADYDDYDEDD